MMEQLEIGVLILLKFNKDWIKSKDLKTQIMVLIHLLGSAHLQKTPRILTLIKLEVKVMGTMKNEETYTIEMSIANST